MSRAAGKVVIKIISTKIIIMIIILTSLSSPLWVTSAGAPSASTTLSVSGDLPLATETLHQCSGSSEIFHLNSLSLL